MENSTEKKPVVLSVTSDVVSAALIITLDLKRCSPSRYIARTSSRLSLFSLCLQPYRGFT